MFVSLNRKIIYSIVFLFLITSLIFVYTFYIVYGNKIQEEQYYNIQRNQQYLDLLNKNINLNRELNRLSNLYPELQLTPALSAEMMDNAQTERELSSEQRQVIEINKSFDERYAAISASIRILVVSSILLFISIIFLGYLITRWILRPINRISNVSEQVTSGNLQVRINHERAPIFTDELDYLTLTFNQMLDNLESVLSEVKDKEAFLQALIDNIPDGIRVLDSNGKIMIANKAYYKQIAAKAPNLSVNSGSMQLPGRAVYTVESIRDLSEDVNFSHQQKLSSLGFLSTSIAHEMKNNLGALRIILELLLKNQEKQLAPDNILLQQLEMIYNEVLHCIEVPERLLKLTRSPNNELLPFDCANSLRDVMALMDFEAKSKGLSINLELPDNLPLIKGSETDFKMIAINLTQNALKAMTSGGKLSIKAHQSSPQRLQISFQDTGCGIAKTDLTHIFEPFFSVEDVHSTKGNGLGLSIVRNLILKLGGNIKVTSKVGIGSCFTVTLPIIKNLAKK